MSSYHRGLDADRITEAALEVADAEGLGKVSMRRVATELGTTPMALYHHVANKDELLDRMADHSLRTLPTVDLDAPWEQELERFFVAFHRLFVARPAVAEVMVQRSLEGPVAMALGDRILERLIAAGFSDGGAVSLFIDLFNYTVGASIYHRSRHGRERFRAIDPATAPTAHRLRGHLAESAAEDQVIAAIRHRIRSNSTV